MNEISISGETLTIEDVVKVARQNAQVKIASDAYDKIEASRKVVEGFVSSSDVVYGITTGFGAFKDRVIDKESTKQLQQNLIRSHAIGVGNPFSEEVVRAIMLIRANSLTKGYSGVRLVVIQTLLDMLNRKVHPIIPEQGSVGSSGDLAPLAHMTLVMMGEGEAIFQGNRLTGQEAMNRACIPPIVLEAKEGLALINGTSVMTAIACLDAFDAENLSKIADISAAMSLEALQGTDKAFDPKIQNVRPHHGQIATAQNILRLIEGSEMVWLDQKARLSKIRRNIQNIQMFIETLAESNPQRHEIKKNLAELKNHIRDLPEADYTGNLLESWIRAEHLISNSNLPQKQTETLVERLKDISHLFGSFRHTCDITNLDDDINRLNRRITELYQRIPEALQKFEKIDSDIASKLSTLLSNGYADSVKSILKAYQIAQNIEPQLIEQAGSGSNVVDELRMLMYFLAFLLKGTKVQDAYSLRCIPQVHGATKDAIRYVKQVLSIEINSATDNPLIFDGEEKQSLSGGNFHGQPVALAMDFLGIALSELGDIAERRITRLLDAHANEQTLPIFLIPPEKAGLNSGFMLFQYTAAALVSENKVLAHPASVDSIPTSANFEDHNSMGTIAARKTQQIVQNVAHILALELATAAQGIDLRGQLEGCIPIMGKGTQAAYQAIRKYMDKLLDDRVMQKELLDIVQNLVNSGELIHLVQKNIGMSLKF